MSTPHPPAPARRARQATDDGDGGSWGNTIRQEAQSHIGGHDEKRSDQQLPRVLRRASKRKLDVVSTPRWADASTLANIITSTACDTSPVPKPRGARNA